MRGALDKMNAAVAVESYASFLREPAHGSHFVQFYEEESSLVDMVAHFLGAGLTAGESVLVIATRDHCAAFRRGLEAHGFDVAGALASGQLVLLDARETLDSLLVGGRPDATRTDEVIGSVLRGFAKTRPGARLRAYGEMVDLLCRDGHPEAALSLEELWNALAQDHSFTLFCAYAMANFTRQADARLYAGVCDTHTHAFPTERYASLESTGAPFRAIGELQQRARALEVELADKQQADAFRLLVASVKDYAIFMLDPDGVVTTWNQGAERIKGYEPAEIIGKHFSIFYPATDVAAGKCDMELEGARLNGRFEDEGWRIRKDGSRFWANVIITAVHDERGALVGFAKVTRDLTERRRAEEERLHLAQEREANRVKDEFLATISHELRTPLNAILGWAGLLAARVKDPYVEQVTTTIRRNAQIQTRLIEDMLDTSRMVGGSLRIDVTSADLAAIVRDAVEAVRPTAHSRGLSIGVEGLEAPMILRGDSVRLQQVVWNVLSNAVKFTDAGGSIFVRVEQRGSEVKLAVRDTGRGIDPEFLPHVFERFRQGDSSTTRRTGGLGLGLAIARHIVELHGGRVHAESAGKNKGATFTIVLPVRAIVPGAEESAERALRSDGSPEEVAHLDGTRVLVVDDEPDARELVAAMLEHRGATVTVAGSAGDARASFESFRPDVVIADVGMPGEDGYGLVRSIRALPSDRGGRTPFIALTAYVGRGDRRRALDAGYDHHLGKPVDGEELVKAVFSLSRE